MSGILDGLYGQLRAIRDSISTLYNEISDNNAKINRLYTAKQQMQNYKSLAEGNKESFQQIIDGFDADPNWSGSKRDDVRACMGDAVLRDYSTYINNVDAALDAICDEITRLENTNLSKGGILTWKTRQENYILNEIRKAFN